MKKKKSIDRCESKHRSAESSEIEKRNNENIRTGQLEYFGLMIRHKKIMKIIEGKVKEKERARGQGKKTSWTDKFK